MFVVIQLIIQIYT